MGSKSTKTTQENKPPAWATPLFKQSAGEASRLYNSGSGGNTFMGDTVAGLSGTTMSGVNQLANAGQSWDTSGTRPLFAQIGAAAASPTSAATNLQDYASGANLKGEGNPFYRERLERDLGDTAAQTNSLMSGAGRYGSGAHTGVLADKLAGQRIAALENDWNREQQNQFNAVGMIDAGNFGSMDRAMGAAGAMAGLDQQNFSNKLAGADATLKAGGILDTQAQRDLSDQVAKWYAADNQDWTRLGMLQSAAAGAAGPYGTQIAQTRQPMDIGSLVGGFGKLFTGKSDARVKENYVPVGVRNGITIWEFTYRGSAQKFRGVMAQMLLDTPNEDAVVMEADGYFAVDYAKLGFPMEMVR